MMHGQKSIKLSKRLVILFTSELVGRKFWDSNGDLAEDNCLLECDALEYSVYRTSPRAN